MASKSMVGADDSLGAMLGVSLQPSSSSSSSPPGLDPLPLLPPLPPHEPLPLPRHRPRFIKPLSRRRP